MSGLPRAGLSARPQAGDPFPQQPFELWHPLAVRQGFARPATTWGHRRRRIGDLDPWGQLRQPPENRAATSSARSCADLEAGRHKTVVTRFPPEPNGYLHIGHAKSICLNFGVAQEFGGRCHLRFDDTNPTKEEQEYIDAIEEDVRWLGFDWGEHLYHASDYFEQLYEWAVLLIKEGKAYVDDLSRGRDPRAPRHAHRAGQGQPVPQPLGRGEPRPLPPHARGRVPRRRARAAGEDRHGRRQHQPARPGDVPHPARRTIPRTGDEWCIYPIYDYAHGQSDAIEGITHSICTLEFEDHRPLYDWFLENLPVPSRPRQIEFARLNLTYTVLSKRVLLRAGARGARAAAGTTRACRPSPACAAAAYPPGGAPPVRRAHRRGQVRERGRLRRARALRARRPEPHGAAAHGGAAAAQGRPHELPGGPDRGARGRQQPRGRSRPARARCRSRASCTIERDDFMEDPPKKFFRLAPGREVRLRYAYFITCQEVVKDAAGRGRRAALHLRPGDARRQRAGRPQGRRRRCTGSPRGMRSPPEVRLYDHLFARPDPGRRRATCSPT